jgi:serine/threonine protein kinase
MSADASDRSISAIDHPQFRCLRSLHRVSLSNDQFSAIFIPNLKFFSECQSARPVRSNMMSDFVTRHSSDVNPREEIGRGVSSIVYLVRDSKRFGTFALKRFREGVYQSVYIAEFEILVKLNHPCILRILTFVPPTKSSPAELHLEWAQNGSLECVLNQAGRGEFPSFWNPTGIAIIILGIVLGMRFMHSRGFIHQDLNPSNILLNSQGRALISDFGSSRSESVDSTPTSSANDHYTAPEIDFEEDWGRKVDIYSFGLILYELVVGSPVFRECEHRDDILEKKRSGFVPVLESRLSPSIGDLIQSCLRFDPDSRPSFDDILSSCDDMNLELVSGADNEAVLKYARGVIEWELSHQLR